MDVPWGNRKRRLRALGVKCFPLRLSVKFYVVLHSDSQWQHDKASWIWHTLEPWRWTLLSESSGIPSNVYVRVCVRLGLRLFCCWQVRQVFLVLMIGTAWFTQSHCGLLKTIHAFFLRIIHKLLLIWAHTIIVGRIPIMSLPSTDFPDKSDSEVNHANTMCFRNAVIKKKKKN